MTTWIEQLEQARTTLQLLRGSIRGNTLSQIKMANKLGDVINIIEAQITVEEALLQ